MGIVALPSYAASNQVSPKLLQDKKEARSIIDPEAIAAVKETDRAISAIDSGNSAKAIEALENSTGKLDILLARNPKLAFISLSSRVEVIDVAPQNKQTFKEYRNRLKSQLFF